MFSRLALLDTPSMMELAAGTSEVPIEPMLAKLTRELPVGNDLTYEPKWDDFRCIAYRDDDVLDMRSRNGKRLTRYFPELESALLDLTASSFVLDGEIIVRDELGLDFGALLQRLHPAASRVRRLSTETPAIFVAFDLIALEGRDLRKDAFAERRELLEKLVAPDEFVRLTPTTNDPVLARSWLEELAGSGLDGVVVKDRKLLYLPGKRAMQKVKLQLTADCVVAGFRWHHAEPVVGSLLLGLYDESATLRHVGLASSFPRRQRLRLLSEIEPYVTEIERHPWQEGFNLPSTAVGRLPGVASRWAEGGRLTWVPLRPELVCEVSYDHWDNDRFRHPPRFVRWRPDRDARSCNHTQFPTPSASIAPILDVP